MPFVLDEYATEMALAADEKPVDPFAPYGPDPGSVIAFTRGDRTGVLMTLAPSEVNT